MLQGLRRHGPGDVTGIQGTWTRGCYRYSGDMNQGALQGLRGHGPGGCHRDIQVGDRNKDVLLGLILHEVAFSKFLN